MITASEAKQLHQTYCDTKEIINTLDGEIRTHASNGGTSYELKLNRVISQDNLKFIQGTFTELGFECFVGADPWANESRITVRW